MTKCEGCGKEVDMTHRIYGELGVYCSLCKAKIEERTEKEYWEAKIRKLEREG